MFALWLLSDHIFPTFLVFDLHPAFPMFLQRLANLSLDFGQPATLLIRRNQQIAEGQCRSFVLRNMLLLHSPLVFGSVLSLYFFYFLVLLLLHYSCFLAVSSLFLLRFFAVSFLHQWAGIFRSSLCKSAEGRCFFFRSFCLSEGHPKTCSLF